MLQWRRDARSIHRALELPDRGGMGRGREMEGGGERWREGRRREGGKKGGRKRREEKDFLIF